MSASSENIGSLRVLPVWMRAIPFFLSALFFCSAIFSVFSPIPLFMVYFRGGVQRQLACILSNCFVVVLLGALGGAGGFHWSAGLASLGIYFIFVAVLSLALPYFLFERKVLPDRSVLYTVLTMASFAAVLLLGYGALSHLNPLKEIHSALSTMFDQFFVNSDPTGGEIPVDEIKKSMLREFPSLLAVFTLLMVWINLVVVMRLNPQKVRQSLGIDYTYLKTWKSPEFLVWPTIASGALILFAGGGWSSLGTNLFKFFLAVYGLQGISILAFFFDLLRLQPLFRTLLYILAVFFMTPLLIALGFFDLWFDFRSKLRQS